MSACLSYLAKHLAAVKRRAPAEVGLDSAPSVASGALGRLPLDVLLSLLGTGGDDNGLAWAITLFLISGNRYLRFVGLRVLLKCPHEVTWQYWSLHGSSQLYDAHLPLFCLLTTGIVLTSPSQEEVARLRFSLAACITFGWMTMLRMMLKKLMSTSVAHRRDFGTMCRGAFELALSTFNQEACILLLSHGCLSSDYDSGDEAARKRILPKLNNLFSHAVLRRCNAVAKHMYMTLNCRFSSASRLLEATSDKRPDAIQYPEWIEFRGWYQEMERKNGIKKR